MPKSKELDNELKYDPDEMDLDDVLFMDYSDLTEYRKKISKSKKLKEKDK